MFFLKTGGRMVLAGPLQRGAPSRRSFHLFCLLPHSLVEFLTNHAESRVFSLPSAVLFSLVLLEYLIFYDIIRMLWGYPQFGAPKNS